MKKIRKILVANRGEIALRIMRSAREMGIATVGVFSECDRMAPHVLFADEAYPIGPSPAADSYLQGHKIAEVCLQSGADAVHPGYGFLSENPAFARLACEHDIVFIGPDAAAMRDMGDKIRAKKIARSAGVPCIECSDGDVRNLRDAKAVADDIGYPVLLKASGGGGGKGMRIVRSSADLASAYDRARSEALASFGNDAVFVEKFIETPKHIEIQILADHHGNCIYFPERDCSVQRRYQKIIEESPSAFLPPALRGEMGEAAVGIARLCGYTNAGTVEFLVDREHNYYFLEMNTRLQVEHPVTECITGMDLVKEQIRIAEGTALQTGQDQVAVQGHAIELRIYAEDPDAGFLPDSGVIRDYCIPSGIGIRVDDGYMQDMEVTVHYDPLISKLIATGRDRAEAIARLKRAIGEYRLTGVKNTLSFGYRVLEDPAFISGDFDTSFLSGYLADAGNDPTPGQVVREAGALVAAARYVKKSAGSRHVQPALKTSRWKNRSQY
jgi:acetyl-CoA carboxylase biotin carboxylase subunit